MKKIDFEINDGFYLFIFLGALWLGSWIGYWLSNADSRQQAVKNECAHYDGKTGEFKWGLPQ